MTELEDVNKDDELVLVRVPRSQAKTLRRIIQREEAYDLFTTKLKTNWIWIVGGGLVTLFVLYEKFNTLIAGAIK